MQNGTGTVVDRDTADVVVVGGGLAGLTAAALLARDGRRVTLYEKARSVGGRAVTQAHGEFHFNLGPHALYRGGAGIRVLRELGIAFGGGVPKASGGYAVAGGVKHTLPGGFVSLLSTGLLRPAGKFEFARLLTSIQKVDTRAIQHLTVRQWLDDAIRQPDVRRLLQALLRLTTYANDPERQSAGAALAQLQLAVTSNVLYLDDGWQVLVDGLRAAAEKSGVRIETGRRVTAIAHDAAVRGVRLADGTLHPVGCVIVAGGPTDAAALLTATPQSPLHRWAEASVPVRAACLDVGLERLPQPRATFALGIDRPLYLSVHSAVAKLSPQGGATIHVAKYLDSAAADAKATEAELERLLDLVQPGWRDVVVERRFLPSMIVSHALTTAADATAGRPEPAVPGIDNLFVVGDWVGSEGWLADASLASARQAAALVARMPAVRCGAAA